MIGTIVNTVAVLIGGAIGLLLRKGIPDRLVQAVMGALGLCTFYIGVSGALKGNNTMVMILSMVIGTIIGEALDLDQKLNKFGNLLERKFQKEGQKVSIAEGFITASLLFCVGAMTIVGSLQSGLTGNHEMLFTKSTLDFVAAIIFASSLGVGVLFSAAFVLVYQGSITLLAGAVAPFLAEAVIAEMTCVGSLLILGLGLNMLKVTNLKIMNYTPAIFLPIILSRFL